MVRPRPQRVGARHTAHAVDAPADRERSKASQGGPTRYVTDNRDVPSQRRPSPARGVPFAGFARTLRAVVRNGLVVVLPLLSLHCARAPDAVADPAVEVDPVSGFVERIVVTLPKDEPPVAAAADAYDYVVITDDRFSAFWNGTARARDGERTASLVLTPQALESGPSVGSSFTIKAIARATGNEIALGGATVAQPPGLVDARLDHYLAFPRAGLAGWQLDSSMRGERHVSPAIRLGRRATEIAAKGPPGAYEWNWALVWERVPYDQARRLDVLMRPTRACDGTSDAPLELSGVSVSDDSGHVVEYCISPRVSSERVNEFAGGHQLVVVQPGRIGAWNVVGIDLDRYATFFRLYPPADGRVRLSLGIRFHATAGDAESGSDTADFADVRVARATAGAR